MRTLKIVSILILSASVVAQAQHTNSGATITIQSGLQIYTTGSTAFVNNSGTINMNGSTLHVSGNFTNNATFNASTSTVDLYGGNQTVGGSVTTFFNLNCSGSGVKSISSNQNVSGTLSLNDRQLSTGANTLFVQSANASAVTTTSGYVTSTVGGSLSRVTNAATAYLFPVGGSIGYRPVEVKPSTTTIHTFNVRFANLDATTEGYNRSTVAGTINGLNSAYFYIVNRASGTDPADVTFKFLPSDGSFAGIARWGGSNWAEVTSVPFSPANPYNQLTAQSLASFSPFILFTTNAAMSIPTLSEWGLIILSLLTLTLVMLFIGRRDLAVAGAGRMNPGLYSVIQSAPFSRSLYFKISSVCLLVAIAGFSVVHVLVGTNGVLDLMGTVACSLIVAYMIHLYMEFDGFKRDI